MSEDLDFFGGSGLGADGFRVQPRASDMDFGSLQRTFPIAGSTDYIRLPKLNKFNDITLGYRRIDKIGSGGGSEWLISWTTIATFATASAANLALNASYYTCSILSGDIYIAIFDPTLEIDAANVNHIVKASIITGTISSITPVLKTNITIQATATFEDIFDPAQTESCFWEILTGGNLRYVSSDTTNTGTGSHGIAVVVLSSDYVTLVSEEIIFNSNQPNVPQWNNAPISYVDAAGKIFIGIDGTSNWASQNAHIGVKDEGIFSFLDTDFAMQLGNASTKWFIALLFQGNTTSITSVRRNIVSDSNLMVQRKFDETTLNDVSRVSIKRTTIDSWLRHYVKVSGGVSL